jgi:ribosomal protein S25
MELVLNVFNQSRGVILTQFSYTIHTHEREIKEKEDKEIKYYQIIPMYILYKKKCVKISFLQSICRVVH